MSEQKKFVSVGERLEQELGRPVSIAECEVEEYRMQFEKMREYMEKVYHTEVYEQMEEHTIEHKRMNDYHETITKKKESCKCKYQFIVEPLIEIGKILGLK